jgi:hypothetical protein
VIPCRVNAFRLVTPSCQASRGASSRDEMQPRSEYSSASSFILDCTRPKKQQLFNHLIFAGFFTNRSYVQLICQHQPVNAEIDPTCTSRPCFFYPPACNADGESFGPYSTCASGSPGAMKFVCGSLVFLAAEQRAIVGELDDLLASCAIPC